VAACCRVVYHATICKLIEQFFAGNSIFFPSSLGNLYFQTTANPALKPEQAFGFDLGQDMRFALGSSVFSWDIYETNVHNLFVNSVSKNGTFNDGVDGTWPVYSQEYLNVGNTRYEGLEAALHYSPLSGLGYVVQGALNHSYIVAVPPGFYDTPFGPFTSNLAILPGENFRCCDIGNSNMPYSQGYGELNFTTSNNVYFAFGLTYYGSNNAFNRPAFVIGNANIRVPLGVPKTYLQFSVDNVFNQYPRGYLEGGAGIPVPTANSLVELTPGEPYGPATARIFIHSQF
jgi:hypothetical protein